MRDLPILFSGMMVRAILDGRKTVTRRIVKPVRGYTQYNVCRPDLAAAPHDVWWHGEYQSAGTMQACPYGQPGDRLWVKETWRPKIIHSCGLDACDCESVGITYAADGEFRDFGWQSTIPDDWTMPKSAAQGNVSALFMPRWASRITLEVTGVRVERLQDISEKDAEAEGSHRELAPIDSVRLGATSSYRGGFIRLWESINGAGSWDANPYIWVIEFKRVEVARG